MTIVTLRSKDGEYTYTKEFESDNTILHVKQYLKSQMEGYCIESIENGIKIILNGKIVSDAVQLRTLGKERLQLVYDVSILKMGKMHSPDAERLFFEEVETNDISVKVAVSVKETGAKMMVDPEDLVVFNGNVYLVKDRKKILTLKSIVDLFGDIRISKEDFAKFMVFFLLLYTGNGGIVFVLGCVFVLEILSRKLSLTHRNHFKSMDHLCRSFYMFFVSLFLIDHAKF
ncbi:uncharacterized protein Eint_030660 [Encephalitozoon intestinalis ATCC 50506]|uniref:Ubiquitin-like domain-containing protein n=1 Tax=Encephalitozoon intestinalis (strain ATCC 50506) TaxID=876142 RepID=E0S675_ENCIT|nr:uncharacterized protein Eint_030660 [Encephalitozoon intestinalis ATCC 50506]ADM11210.1 hypothetical protein Eint_030660 [Encephalitozoon intestinalis ATCC 50506]UTX44878.1 hypothetical protein GPK93_03g04050 [Encephalitozoon intestinalis]